MPELPDITAYVEALRERIAGRQLRAVRLKSPFLLRTAVPPIASVEGRTVTAVDLLGKRIVFAFDGDLRLVLHLMIAGRLHWRPPGAPLGSRSTLAAFDFDEGSLTLTEAGSKRRASLHLVEGVEALAAHHRGGLEVLAPGVGLPEFEAVLGRENRTLKRALTDQRLFSGIGNAYSDEILHRARLSPVTLTSRLTAEERARLHAATCAVLDEWMRRLRAERAGGFPEKVTAFREDFAVHGRFGKPCPDCGSPVQRIVHASNETNYCARCQTEGRLLADRALSRLLRKDWPRTLDELEG